MWVNEEMAEKWIFRIGNLKIYDPVYVMWFWC